MKVSVIQMPVEQNKQKNLEIAAKMISDINRPELVVLPEMFNCPYDIDLFPSYAESDSGATTEFLAETALQHGIYLVGGSIPERDGSKIYNTSFVFNPQGKLLGKHRKLHLFDVNIKGGPCVQESKTLTPGNEMFSFLAGKWHVGLAICYDIRFPELMRALTLKGAEVIIIPAVFNTTTGKAHWHDLLRIRAVDNQVYLVGASPARNAEAGYVAYGHSMIVDPWGDVLASAGSETTVVEGIISKERIEKIRQEFPLLRHRRKDLYRI